jgi:pimeloyl-ACP methyl ester carboxylesterase
MPAAPVAAGAAPRLVSAPRPGGGRPASFWRFEDAPPPGSGAAPLLALPGLGLDGRAFARWAPLAASRDLVLANLPNEVPPGADMAHFAREALAALDAAGHAGRPAVLAGSSFGGMVALAAALAAPDRVAALVLLGTAPGWPHLRARLRVLSGLHALVPRRAYPSVFAELMLPRFRWIEPTLREEMRVQMLHRTKEFLGASVAAIRGFDATPRLREIRAPALVLHGERDPVFPPRAAEALAAGLPRATLCTVDGCGHLPHLTHPAESLRAIEAFLAEAAA